MQFPPSSSAQNFACTVIEAQHSAQLLDADGRKTDLALQLDRWDAFFTAIFALELAAHAFCHWLTPFVTNAWSWLDALIVVLSIVGVLDTEQPTGIARSIRALRVVRLFGRVKSLR